MTYDPLIPQANDLISTSQQEILDNFTQIGALFGSNATADHFAFDNATAAKRGLHKRITFYEPLGADPAVAGTTGYLYPKADASDTGTNTQLYFRNTLGITQITNRFTSAASSGYTMLPGGLIMMWGRQTTFNATVAGVGVQNVVFPTIANYTGGGYVSGFPNAVFSIQISMLRADADTSKVLSVQSGGGFPTATSFNLIYSSANMNSVYWFAIGN